MPTVSQLAQKFSSFYWNLTFITVFTTARRHWFLYWNIQLSLILNIHFNIISLLRLNSDLSPWGSPSEAFYINSCHIPRPSHPPAFRQPNTTGQYTAVNSATAANSNYAVSCRLLFQPSTHVTAPHNPHSRSARVPQFLHVLITTHPHVSWVFKQIRVMGREWSTYGAEQRCILGFRRKTWGKETTWKTLA